MRAGGAGLRGRKPDLLLQKWLGQAGWLVVPLDGLPVTEEQADGSHKAQDNNTCTVSKTGADYQGLLTWGGTPTGVHMQSIRIRRLKLLDRRQRFPVWPYQSLLCRFTGLLRQCPPKITLHENMHGLSQRC